MSGQNVGTRIHLNTSDTNGSLTTQVVVNRVGAVQMTAYGAGTATFDASGNITAVSACDRKTRNP